MVSKSTTVIELVIRIQLKSFSRIKYYLLTFL